MPRRPRLAGLLGVALVGFVLAAAGLTMADAITGSDSAGEGSGVGICVGPGATAHHGTERRPRVRRWRDRAVRGHDAMCERRGCGRPIRPAQIAVYCSVECAEADA